MFWCRTRALKYAPGSLRRLSLSWHLKAISLVVGCTCWFTRLSVNASARCEGHFFLDVHVVEVGTVSGVRQVAAEWVG